MLLHFVIETRCTSTCVCECAWKSLAFHQMHLTVVISSRKVTGYCESFKTAANHEMQEDIPHVNMCLFNDTSHSSHDPAEMTGTPWDSVDTLIPSVSKTTEWQGLQIDTSSQCSLISGGNVFWRCLIKHLWRLRSEEHTSELQSR